MPKKYQCPECGAIHTAERWNAETNGEPIVEIEKGHYSCKFVCPSCKKEIFTTDTIEI